MLLHTRSLSRIVSVYLLLMAASAEMQPNFERIDRLIRLFRDGTRTPGMSVAIVMHGQPVFVHSYGLRNHTDDRSHVTTDTLFEIGSCTKAFNSYLVASLVKEGAIAYNDPVIEHIPEFRLSDAEVTKNVQIRDLLDHASGLPSHDAVWYHANISRNELLQRLPHLRLSYGLREKYHYSNIMYTVAGMAVERVTKRTWEDEIRERIFRPLNMTRSLASFAEAQQLPADADIAKPHSTARENASVIVLLPRQDITSVAPSGSIHSTANDMVKWIQFQLSDAAPKEMHVLQMPHKSAVPSGQNEDGKVVDVGYGYGWLVKLYRGQYVLRHSGQTDGFCSAVTLFPEAKHGIALLANSDVVCIALAGLLIRVYDIAANHSLSQSDEEWVSSIVEQPRDSGVIISRKSVHQPEQYTGRYEDEGYGVVEVSLVASQLSAFYNNILYILRPKDGVDFFTLLPQSHGRTDGAQEVECSFQHDSSGEVIALHVAFEPAVSPIFFQKKVLEAQDVHYLGLFVGTFSDAATSVQISLNTQKRLLVAQGLLQYEPERLVPVKRNWFCINRCTLKLEFALKSGNVSELYVHQGAEILYTLEKQSV